VTVAVFLDRDGTLNVEREGFISDPDDLELLPCVGAALRALAESGLMLIVVTNQSGIARGVVSPAAYSEVTGRLEELIAEHAPLAGVYHCPHHPDFSGPCGCRKPEPGLLRRAATDHGIDLARSFVIGDAPRDIAAGRAAGCGRTFLVRTGKGEASIDTVREEHPETTIVDDLAAAVREILG
jgi:D-glycero-D-manno-heptose 1,7-bisphosphate phosphatase